MGPEMPDELLSLHTAISSSSKSSPAALRASCRLSSSASRSVTPRVSSSSSRLASWQLTPGTSSIQPIHQPELSFTTAVYVWFNPSLCLTGGTLTA